MVRHLKIEIYGRVQGVFFRHSARKEAEKLNIAGFVRNEPDDSVYIEAEGEEEKLKKFLGLCREGPPLAKVEKVEHEFSDKLHNYKAFEIQ